MTEKTEVDAIIADLRQTHQEILEDLKDKEWTDEDINAILEAAEKVDPSNAHQVMKEMGEFTTRKFNKRIRHSQFQALPRLAKLSFEDFNNYQDALEELSTVFTISLLDIYQRALLPKLFDKLLPKEPWEE